MSNDTAVTARRSGASARRAVAAVWRIEAARIVAGLTRYTGDFSLAEDLAQEALAEALALAIDLERDRAGAADELPWNPDEIADDTLRLVYTACHPLLSPQARTALALRVVAGLTTDEIARCFLLPVATVQQRIVRAKRTLADAGVAFETPPRDERPARRAAVLATISALFTEGHTATAGDEWMRPDLARDALRLARVLASLEPGEAEVHGLLALLELTAARFPARVGPDGEPVLLSDQDRRRWDRAAIHRGRDALRRAESLGHGLGPYGLQAAIAECHDVAASVEQTDWARIVVLYEALEQLDPSPIVRLNRAVAVGEASGPAAALEIVDELAEVTALGRSHLLPSVRGELLARLDRHDEANIEFSLAADRAHNARERALLLAKATRTRTRR